MTHTYNSLVACMSRMEACCVDWRVGKCCRALVWAGGHLVACHVISDGKGILPR